MVKVAVSIEERFYRTPDGKIWAPNDDYAFWTRYLEVFDAVKVIARVKDSESIPHGWRRADGDNVSFSPIPYYIGPWEYLPKTFAVSRAAKSSIGEKDAVILRVASQIAARIYPELRKSRRPYGVEVVADPYDVFGPGSRHRFRHIFRWKFCTQLKRQCFNAVAAAYVTKRSLQYRYPPSPRAFSTNYSSVELSSSAYIEVARRIEMPKKRLTVVTVGSLESMGKGIDILIEATCLCKSEGLDIQLIIIGEGRSRSVLESKLDHGSRTFIKFVGQLPREAVFLQLDRADLFVLPSRSEGLPRAMIEAMARGLPCIGSTVGGIPELLPSEDLVPPGDVGALARTIQEVLSDPNRMQSMSVRNLEVAHGYHEDVLRKRRIEYYRYLRKLTENYGAKMTTSV